MYEWKLLENKLQLERCIQLKNDRGPSVLKERKAYRKSV